MQESTCSCNYAAYFFQKEAVDTSVIPYALRDTAIVHMCCTVRL